MSDRLERTPSHETDIVTEWIEEANRDFFGEAKEPLPVGAVERAFVGFLVVAIGVGLIVWQVLQVG